ncbi:MAG: M91 family zinc metallopeptidase [Bryobacteraceae bacterium]
MPKTISTTKFPFIVIDNDDSVNPYFRLTVIEALDKIDSKPVGKALLKAISDSPIDGSSGFKVKIVRGEGIADITKPGQEGGSRAVPFNEVAARGGGGSKAACFWNPNIFYNPAAGTRPAYIGLAHELVHCMHSVLGTMKPGYDEEEKFTVGLDPYAGVAICENTIRGEHGLDLRDRY